MKRVPRVGDVVNLIANQVMMDVGQFVYFSLPALDSCEFGTGM
jgi:hypothetical protein